jgi:hypothetical protein
MTEKNRETKAKGRPDLATKLNEVVEQSAKTKGGLVTTKKQPRSAKTKATKQRKGTEKSVEEKVNAALDAEFEQWNAKPFIPEDAENGVPINSLEASVGYTSLFRQMHQAYGRRVAYHKSPIGGSLSSEDAIAKTYHECTDAEDAKEEFRRLQGLPIEHLNFIDLVDLQRLAPRVAERLWEQTKREAKKEFLSGHLSANICFPVGYMKQVWNIAKFLGVREAFIADWKPSGAIEISLIDMMTQTFFQWQYWIEQTVTRAETEPRREHYEYTRWKNRRDAENRANGWKDGQWDPPTVSEQEALEHAVQMADRWHRMYMRTLRQLRDLRRYSPVTINNPNQVNIANEGGQQVNVAPK